MEVSRSTAQSILRLIGGIIMQQAARNILLSYCKRETTNSATQPDKPLKMAVQPVRTHYGHFKNIVFSQIESRKPPPKDNLA